MGHVVNPISFRLGYSQLWKSQWFKIGNTTKYLKFLREDLLFFKYFECFFQYFKFIKKFDKNYLKRQLKQKSYLRPSKLKKFKLKNFIVVNFFNTISLLFSHINVIRFFTFIEFSIFIYDASIQYIKPINFIYNLVNKEKYKIKKFLFRIKRYKFRFINLRFLNYQNKYKFVNLVYKSIKKKFNLKKRLFISFLNNFYLKLKIKFNFIKLFKFLFLLFLFHNKNLIKIFIMKLLILLLLNLKKKIKYYINFVKFNNVLKKIKLNLIKINSYLLYLNYNILINYNFIKDLYFKRRFKFFLYLSRIIYKDFNKIKLNLYNSCNYHFYGLTNLNVTASMLCNYIGKKLSQKYTIFEILKPVVKDLGRNFSLFGFKISCAGRLTKKQRASLIVEKKRSVPLSTMDFTIDYSIGYVILRHGICGLKIWLNKKKIFKSYFYSLFYKY